MRKADGDFKNAEQGWQWDSGTKTLTLDNCTINTKEQLAISVPTCTIYTVKGTDNYAISTYDGEESDAPACGIFSERSITFDGDGTLSGICKRAKAEGTIYRCGIYADMINVKSGTLFAHAGAVEADSQSAGLAVMQDLNIDRGIVNAKGETQAVMVYGNITATGASIFGNPDADATALTEAHIDRADDIASVYMGDSKSGTETIAKAAKISFAPTIIVGEQDGVLTTGKLGTATFGVTTKNFGVKGNPDYNPHIEWITNTHNGINLTMNASENIEASITEVAAAGEYWFKIVSDSYESDAVSLKITRPKGNIIVTVTKDSNTIVDATVTLKKGSETVGDPPTYATDGKYTFAAVEYGVYNLIVDATIETMKKTITAPVTLDRENLSASITIPTVNGNQNTIVETKNETPNISADLNALFDKPAVTEDAKGITEEDKNTIKGGGTVELKLTAEKQDSPLDAETIKTFANDKNADFLFVDLTAKKTVTTNGGAKKETILKELNDLIEVNMEIPAKYRNQDLRIFRMHEGLAEELKQNANTFGEKFSLNADCSIATLTIKRFSTFALSNAAPPINQGDGSVGSSYNYYRITATAGAGGSISTGKYVSVREGDSAVFTMTPDKGYAVADVKVDGKSVGAVAQYTFTNVKENHTIEVNFKVSSGHVNPQTGVAFEDVSSNDWFYDAVYKAVENGWFAGTSDTTFGPNLDTTRGMIVTVLWKMEKKPVINYAMSFSDIAKTATIKKQYVGDKPMASLRAMTKKPISLTKWFRVRRWRLYCTAMPSIRDMMFQWVKIQIFSHITM